jgi:hypothetical protein
MLTYGLVLYLDTDPPVYKLALDVPKDLRSDLVTFPYQEPPVPLLLLTI